MPAQGMVGFDLAACPPSSKHRFLPSPFSKPLV